MRIHYLQKSRNAAWIRYRLVFLFIVVIAILYYGGGFLFPGLTSAAFRFVGTPLWQTKIYVGNFIASERALLNSKQSLIQENKSLALELAALQARLLEFSTLEAGIDQSTPPLGGSGVKAPVLVRPPQTVFDTFIVGKGSAEGVKVGDHVFSGIVRIGEITRVSPGSAEARLFSSPGNEFQVSLGREGEFTARGKGGGTYELKVPQDVAVKVSDPITTTGTEVTLYGNVEYIGADKSDSFKHVLFRIPLNLNQLLWVEVKTTSTNE